MLLAQSRYSNCFLLGVFLLLLAGGAVEVVQGKLLGLTRGRILVEINPQTGKATRITSETAPACVPEALNSVNAGAVDAAGNLLFMLIDGQQIFKIDATTGACSVFLTVSWPVPPGAVSAMAIDANNRLIVANGAGRSLASINLETGAATLYGRLVNTEGSSESVDSLAFDETDVTRLYGYDGTSRRLFVFNSANFGPFDTPTAILTTLSEESAAAGIGTSMEYNPEAGTFWLARLALAEVPPDNLASANNIVPILLLPDDTSIEIRGLFFVADKSEAPSAAPSSSPTSSPPGDDATVAPSRSPTSSAPAACSCSGVFFLIRWFCFVVQFLIGRCLLA